MNTSVILRGAMASDQGPVRPNNEDSAYAGDRLLAVADGVSGQAAGEVASALTIAALEPLDAARPGDPVAALRAAVATANERILAAGREDPARAGMATTLTALLLSGTELALAHVGDSRAYRLRDGELTQLSRDDSYVQQLVDAGRLDPADIPHHPYRSVVTRFLPAEPPEATYTRYPVVPGDRYLLCSDGLSDVVPAELIRTVLDAEADPDRCVARLVGAALAAGGPDNITVVVADARAADPAPSGGVLVARDGGGTLTRPPAGSPRGGGT